MSRDGVSICAAGTSILEYCTSIAYSHSRHCTLHSACAHCTIAAWQCMPAEPELHNYPSIYATKSSKY
eukprot:1395031-Amorphochlora_amoeboformis.AAC.1